MNKLKLKYETISNNNKDYLILSLKDRQQYIDTDQAAAKLGISESTWPLFGVVWPSSIILASTVSQLNLKNKRVLEIGCGIAFSSIVLHKMGVNITASDYHPLARVFLEINIRNNEMPPIQYQTGNWEIENPLLGDYDLIIGSDILYEPHHAEKVSQFIFEHSNKNTKVIIVDPGRSNRSRFTRNMQTLGYAHHYERFNMMDLDRKSCKGRILYYRRQAVPNDSR